MSVEIQTGYGFLMVVQPPHLDCKQRRRPTLFAFAALVERALVNTQLNSRIISAVPHFCGEWIPLALTTFCPRVQLPGVHREYNLPLDLGPGAVGCLRSLFKVSDKAKLPRNRGEDNTMARRPADSVCQLLSPCAFGRCWTPALDLGEYPKIT
jgi:hypothetical protein